MPSTVLAIGDEAFYGCQFLTDCAIGTGVTNIGYECFCNCFNLTSLSLPASLTNLEENPWTGCTNLTAVTVDPGNSVYASVSNVIYNHAMTTLVQMAPGKTGAFTVPSSVTTIGSGSMAWAKISSITVPTSVTTIKEYAMAHCYGLTTVTVPSSVTSIEKGAFGACIHLTTINLPDSIHTLTYRLFVACYDLESITIPHSITTIEGWVFRECTNLTSMTFEGLTAPTSVQSDWLYLANGAAEGHAYNTSNFPTPGNTWNGLMMGECIGSAVPPMISSVPVTTGQVNATYSYQVVASGEDDVYSLVSNATWLTIDPATGLISGTPTAAGTFYVNVTVTNGGGSDCQNYTLTVTSGPFAGLSGTIELLASVLVIFLVLTAVMRIRR